MTLGAPIVLAAAEFDDRDLVLAPLRDDLGVDLAAFDERRAELDLLSLADEQDLIECDGVADGGVEALYANALALAGAVLLTAGAKYGIHDEVLLARIEGGFPSERPGILETCLRRVKHTEDPLNGGQSGLFLKYPL
jgi:hypothetical protein